MKTSDLTSGEYHPFYKPYIEALGDVELLDMLERQMTNFPQFIVSIPDDKWHYSYAEGKWTVAQVLVHILDAERIFQYRALRFARNDKTPLPGFEQDDYIPNSGADTITKASFIKSYQILRASTLDLFQSFDDEKLMRIGTGSNVQMSVRALGFFCCGHQKHHKKILKDRYM